MFALVLVLLVGMPLWLPLLCLDTARDRRRRRTEISQVTCERCGTALDMAALDRADAAWSSHVAKLRADYPNAMLRLHRRIFAVCGRCRAQYDYDKARRTYALLLPDEEYVIPGDAAETVP